MPSTVYGISYNSFTNTKWLKDQKYDENGCLIVNNILLRAETDTDTFTVPSNVLAVGEGFKVVDPEDEDIYKEESEKLKKVVITENVVEVRKYAFQSYDNLECVEFENNHTYVEPHAFSCCSKLTDVKLPLRNKITTYAFERTPFWENIMSDMNLVEGVSKLPEDSVLHDSNELKKLIGEK